MCMILKSRPVGSPPEGCGKSIGRSGIGADCRPMMVVGLLALSLLVPASVSALTGAEIRTQSKLSWGLVVHLGCGNGSFTIELTNGKTYLVHGLAKTDADVTAARTAIAAANMAGVVSVERATGWDLLPYANNLADIVVVDADELGAQVPSASEIRRTAAPVRRRSFACAPLQRAPKTRSPD